MNLLDLFPQRRYVEAPTGTGFFWGLLPFRLADLAYLDGVVARIVGDPFAGERVRLRTLRAAAGGDYWSEATPESSAYAGAIRDLDDLLDDPEWVYPPLLSEEGIKILATPEGRVEWLVTLFGRPDSYPDFGAEEAADLALVLDAEARLAIEAAAYGLHPTVELSSLMDAAPGGVMDWGRAIVQMIESTGWTFVEVASLYLPQWNAYQRAERGGHGSLSGPESWQTMVGNRRMRMLSRTGRNGHGG